MPTTPPDPWNERVRLFDAVDEAENMATIRAILTTEREGVEEARKVAEIIAEVYDE